jgi:hypothetical protein
MGFKPQDFGQKSHFYGQLLTRFRPKTPSRREFVGHLVEKPLSGLEPLFLTRFRPNYTSDVIHFGFQFQEMGVMWTGLEPLFLTRLRPK